MKKLRLIVLALASLLALQANSQIYTQGFNGGSLPSGWGVTVTNTTATLPAITFETASVHPTGLAPSEGTHMVRFNSYSCQSSGSIRLAQTTPIATTGGFAGVAVSFDWSTDDEYPNNDVVVVQYSLDGTTWVDINSYSRAGGATVSWNSISCPLPVAAINKPAVYIGLHFISAYGNDCYLDNLKVIGSTSLLYCESASTSAADEDILNVTFAGINNTSTCSTTGGLGSILNKYSNYYKTVTPATVFAGSSYPISIQIGTCGTSNYRNMVKVYFDFNQDGDFSDADETAYVSGSSTLGPHTETASILIPATAVADTIPMRIVNVETTFDTDIAPCGAYNYGETEDYAVIVTIPSCLAPTNIIVSGVTHNFALVNWTEAGTATKWNIQYGPSGFTLGTGTFIHNVPATNSGIGGFSPSTAYDIYIQDSCGPGDNSVWAGPISFTTAPTCPAPSAVTLGVYTATMANINWTENGSATTWQIEVGLAGYTPGSGTKNNTIIRPNSIGPLLPNTTYDVRVRSICSPGDTSLWSSPMSFTTKCTYYTVPYIETFETSSTNCWSVTDIDLDGIVWEVSPIGNHTLAGSYCAYHNYNGSIMQDGYLISPEIITPTSANTKLSFWSYNSFVADYDKNSVLISRDGGSTFTEVWSPASVVNSWAKDSIDITSYNNDTIIIAFRYEGQNAHRWLVDDIRVDQTISYNISTTKANVKACDTLGISSLPIDITNAGTTIIPMGQSIDISYKIDGGSVVTNTINLAAALNPPVQQQRQISPHLTISTFLQLTIV